MRMLAFILLIGAMLPGRASAETAAEARLALNGGDRIRLSRGGAEREVFTVWGCRNDTLVVGRQGALGSIEIPRRDIDSLELSLPRTTLQGVFYWGGWGFLVVGGIGAITGAIWGSGPGCGGNSGQEICVRPNAFGGAVILGALGGVAGAIVGGTLGFFAPGHRWVRVDTPLELDCKPELTLLPAVEPPPTGAGAHLVLRFEF